MHACSPALAGTRVRTDAHPPRGRRALRIAHGTVRVTVRVTVGVLVTAGTAVVASATPAAAVPGGGMFAVKDLPDVISSATSWLTGIAFLVATFFLTLGGIRRMLAAGDPSEVEKSKEAFKSAGFGYALAVLAPVLAEILKGILGA
jgi:hypothetical protein